MPIKGVLTAVYRIKELNEIGQDSTLGYRANNNNNNNNNNKGKISPVLN
jgi:hypothetical protein